MAGEGQAVPPDMLKGVNTKISRLLSIDGGGTLGVIPARLLVEVEDEIRVQLRKRYNNDPRYDWEFPVHLADYFDCLAGTSTGAILTTFFAAKGAKVQENIVNNPEFDQELYKRLRGVKEMPKNAGSAEAALAVYLMTSKLIFPPRSIWSLPKSVAQLSGPIYAKDGIETVLETAFADMKLSDLETNLLVPSYNISENAALAFYSASFDGISRTQGKAMVDYPEHNAENAPNVNVFSEKMKNDPTYSVVVPGSGGRLEHAQDLEFQESDYLLKEVVRASSAAPLYFPAATVTPIGDSQSVKMIDGGVTSNNPTMHGMLMLAKMGKVKNPQEDLAILSLGTGRLIRTLEDKAEAGLYGWGRDLINIFMGGTSWMTQALVDEFLYNILRLPPPRYLRVQKTVLDNGENQEVVDTLRDLDASSDEQLQSALNIAEGQDEDIYILRNWVRSVIFDPSK